MGGPLDVVAAAVGAGAAEVHERPGDPLRSFLEATFEAAIIRHLPGGADTSQQRRRWVLRGFEPHPYGVDILWQPGRERVGVEVKVTDVGDSLFDVIKLATALGRKQLTHGCTAVAATAAQWSRGGVMNTLTGSGDGRWRVRAVADLLDEPAARAAVLVSSGPRPVEVPAQIETLALEELPMPHAPTHVVRMLAVRPVSEGGWLRLT